MSKVDEAKKWMETHPFPAPNATDQALWMDAWRILVKAARTDAK